MHRFIGRLDHRTCLIAGLVAASLCALVTPSFSAEVHKMGDPIRITVPAQETGLGDVKVVLPSAPELKVERPMIQRQNQIFNGPALGRISSIEHKMRDVRWRPSLHKGDAFALVPS